VNFSNLFKSVVPVLGSFAPQIATALGGPLAGAAVEFLAGKFGIEPTAEAVQQHIAAMTPADLVKMKEIDVEFQEHMADNGIKLQLAQIAVNAEEAKSPNWFVAGWRPGVGWVCVIALALTYIPKAVVLTVFWAYQAYITLAHPEVKIAALPAFPDLGVTDLLGLLGAILGIGAMRTVEKVKDAESNR